VPHPALSARPPGLPGGSGPNAPGLVGVDDPAGGEDSRRGSHVDSVLEPELPPLAASAMMGALILAAFSLVIAFSRAAGMRMSTSSSSNSPASLACASGYPATVRRSPFSLCARTACQSSPCGLWIAPLLSDRATTLAPDSAMNLALKEPALPNPWMATFTPFRGLPSFSAACWMQRKIPRAVDWFLPWDPPKSRG
jgi:hypothetical protein